MRQHNIYLSSRLIMLNMSGFVFVYVVFNNQLLDFGVKKITEGKNKSIYKF